MKFRAYRTLVGSIAVAGVAVLSGCSSSTDGAAQGGAAGASGASGSSGTGASTSGVGAGGLSGQTLGGLDPALVGSLCGGSGCACSDGKDNDGDGLIDGMDPECTGPLDNDEGSFATGIPGDNSRSEVAGLLLRRKLRRRRRRLPLLDGLPHRQAPPDGQELRPVPAMPRLLQAAHLERLRLLRVLHRRDEGGACGHPDWNQLLPGQDRRRDGVSGLHEVGFLQQHLRHVRALSG